VNGKPKEGDFKKAASFIGNVLGASVMTAALGTTGPIGLLTFMAVKHVAAPALFRVVQKAFSKPPPKGWTDEDSYGYWENGKWVPESKEEWERNYDSRDNDHEKHVPKRLQNASLVSASDDEEYMKALIDGISEYAEEGEIPPEAWKAAIAELGAGAAPDEEQQDQDQDQESPEKEDGPDTGSGITSRLLSERARSS